MNDRDGYLALAFFAKLPAFKGLPIIKQIGSSAAFFNLPKESLISAGLTAEMAESIIKFRETWKPDFAEAAAEAEGIRVITWQDAEYPARLKELPDAPYALFVRGSLLGLAESTIAIVGTRRATTYGLSVTDRLSRELS